MELNKNILTLAICFSMFNAIQAQETSVEEATAPAETVEVVKAITPTENKKAVSSTDADTKDASHQEVADLTLTTKDVVATVITTISQDTQASEEETVASESNDVATVNEDDASTTTENATVATEEPAAMVEEVTVQE